MGVIRRIVNTAPRLGQSNSSHICASHPFLITSLPPRLPIFLLPAGVVQVRTRLFSPLEPLMCATLDHAVIRPLVSSTSPFPAPSSFGSNVAGSRANGPHPTLNGSITGSNGISYNASGGGLTHALNHPPQPSQESHAQKVLSLLHGLSVDHTGIAGDQSPAYYCGLDALLHRAAQLSAGAGSSARSGGGDYFGLPPTLSGRPDFSSGGSNPFIPTKHTSAAEGVWAVHPVVAAAVDTLRVSITVYDAVAAPTAAAAPTRRISDDFDDDSDDDAAPTAATSTDTGGTTPTTAANQLVCRGLAAIPALALAALSRDYAFVRDLVVRYAHVHRDSVPAHPSALAAAVDALTSGVSSSASSAGTLGLSFSTSSSSALVAAGGTAVTPSSHAVGAAASGAGGGAAASRGFRESTGSEWGVSRVVVSALQAAGCLDLAFFAGGGHPRAVEGGVFPFGTTADHAKHHAGGAGGEEDEEEEGSGWGGRPWAKWLNETGHRRRAGELTIMWCCASWWYFYLTQRAVRVALCSHGSDYTTCLINMSALH